jgi:hypothetical protein
MENTAPRMFSGDIPSFTRTLCMSIARTTSAAGIPHWDRALWKMASLAAAVESIPPESKTD